MNACTTVAVRWAVGGQARMRRRRETNGWATPFGLRWGAAWPGVLSWSDPRSRGSGDPRGFVRISAGPRRERDAAAARGSRPSTLRRGGSAAGTFQFTSSQRRSSCWRCYSSGGQRPCRRRRSAIGSGPTASCRSRASRRSWRSCGRRWGPEAVRLRTVRGFGYALDLERATELAGSPKGPVVAAASVVLAGACDSARSRAQTYSAATPARASWWTPPGVSRRHARIVINRARATLEDLGSKNGTYLGKRRIAGPTALEDRDQLSLGQTALLYRCPRRLASTRSEVP